MKDLERENARLRQAVSDLTLDELNLKETARGNDWTPPRQVDRDFVTRPGDSDVCKGRL